MASRPLVLHEAPFEDLVEPVAHILKSSISARKPRPAAIHAEHGHGMRRTRRAACGRCSHRQLRPPGSRRPPAARRPALDAGRAEVDRAVALGKNLAPAGVQVRRRESASSRRRARRGRCRPGDLRRALMQPSSSFLARSIAEKLAKMPHAMGLTPARRGVRFHKNNRRIAHGSPAAVEPLGGTLHS